MALKRLIEKLIGKEELVHVTDQAILDRYLNNPNFPWLISFPRTGSHWLRMLMELYFEKPSLRRIFFYHEAQDFTCYHWHDVDLTTVDVKSVIYLYRDPVETVYSTLQYHKEDIENQDRVLYWAEVYGAHLQKWLVDEKFTTKKTLIRYDLLKSNLNAEFGKICSHLGLSLDVQKLHEVEKQVSKDKLKAKTPDDQQVVNVSEDYSTIRAQFSQKYTTLINSTIFDKYPHLLPLMRESTI